MLDRLTLLLKATRKTIVLVPQLISWDDITVIKSEIKYCYKASSLWRCCTEYAFDVVDKMYCKIDEHPLN